MKSTLTLALGLAVLSASLVGCGTGQIQSPQAVLPQEESPGLVDRLSSLETVDENTALRAVLMLVDGKDDCKTFSERIEKLKDRKLVDPKWDFDADKPITRGKLAYMVFTGCGINGGVTLALFGPSQRYCLRELKYKGIIISGDQAGAVSGMETIAILSRADAYMETGEIPETLNVKGGR
ncbi:MAG TPA: hypothetical protein ENL03_00880 [Phycisphaerae bacterium]|nr:hypothetical protein [Phycisphaerae bacterium]